MNFKVENGKLSKELKAIKRVINDRDTLPYLRDFRFEVNQSVLKITGNNCEMEAYTIIDIEGEDDETELEINAKDLINLLKPYKAKDMLTFDTVAGTIDVNGMIQIPFVKEEYHDDITMPEDDTTLKSYVSMFSDTFIKALERVSYCINSKERDKPSLCGVYIGLEEDHMDFVGTDAHVLVKDCIKDFSTSGISEDSRKYCIMDVNFVNIVTRTIKDGHIKLCMGNKAIMIKNESYTFIMRNIPEKYPNYNAVFPTLDGPKVIVDRKEFLNTLKMVNTTLNNDFIANDHNRVIIEIKEGILKIKTAKTECKVNMEGCRADTFVGFNGIFLQRIFEHIPGDKISFINLSTQDTGSSAKLIMPEDSNEDVSTVLMIMVTEF